MSPKATPAPATPAIAQVKTVPFKGELPKRGGGFQRKPNPFDALFSTLEFDAEGKSANMLTEVEYKDPAELKPYVTLLRNAAAHVDKGLDVWTVDNGIVWQARPRRTRKTAAA